LRKNPRDSLAGFGLSNIIASCLIFLFLFIVLFMLGRCSAKLGDAKSDKRWN
jgi:hypothetical protein